MSTKKQKEIIGLLENTILLEKSKIRPNSELLDILNHRLDRVINYEPKK